MARYKPCDAKQITLVPISFQDQILPGSLEYALMEIVDQHIDSLPPVRRSTLLRPTITSFHDFTFRLLQALRIASSTASLESFLRRKAIQPVCNAFLRVSGSS